MKTQVKRILIKKLVHGLVGQLRYSDFKGVARFEKKANVGLSGKQRFAARKQRVTPVEQFLLSYVHKM